MERQALRSPTPLPTPRKTWSTQVVPPSPAPATASQKAPRQAASNKTWLYAAAVVVVAAFIFFACRRWVRGPKRYPLPAHVPLRDASCDWPIGASVAIEPDITPLHRIYALEAFASPQECSFVVGETSRHAASTKEGKSSVDATGWYTSRHSSYATTDMPVKEVPAVKTWVEDALTPRLAQALRQLYSVKLVGFNDLFVVKYEDRGGVQDRLDLHRDASALSFVLLLNDPATFEGGGTFFESLTGLNAPGRDSEGKFVAPPSATLRPNTVGTVLLQPGKVRHGARPVTKGARYVLVGFCRVEASWLQPYSEIEGAPGPLTSSSAGYSDSAAIAACLCT